MDSDDDVSVVKIIPAQRLRKGAAWVTSSFDDFGSTDFGSSQKLAKSHSVQKRPSSCSSSENTSSKSSLSQVSRKRQRSDCLPAHKLMSVVKSNSHRNKLKSALRSELWSDKHQPRKKEDLAVHKKKVEDISGWLKEKTNKLGKQQTAAVLLLTGPPGSGKTAAIKTMAAELKLEVQEWTNPTTSDFDSHFRTGDQTDWTERSSVDVYSSQSQAALFSNFLLRANKYQALQLGLPSSAPCCDRGRFILVEDIPNAFYRDPSELHNILRKYRRCGHCPLVFVVSDASNSSSNVQRLFPPSLQEELRLESISVNPVAPTMMVKMLNKIACVEAAQGRFAVPSARVVESIAMSSAGDIRSAINALQFACRQDTVDLNKLRSVQKQLKKESSGSGRRLKYGSLAKQDSGTAGPSQSQVVIGAKDTTCFLFHALGKILYFKRGSPADNSEHPKLPAHLSQHERDPLLLTPEEVVEKTHLSGDYFNTFLHQNYVDFIQSVEDLDRASEYLSDADMLSALYTSRGQLQDYSTSVATRGIIHSQSSLRYHTDSRKGHGWRPLHKSQWFATQRQSQESKATAMRLFRGHHWDPEVLLTELVPYINLSNPTLHDPGQISLVQNLCQFSRSSYSRRSGLERIDEKDAVEDETDDESQSGKSSAPACVAKQTTKTSLSSSAACDDDREDVDNICSSQSAVKTVPAEMEDEEFVIEEFDD